MSLSTASLDSLFSTGICGFADVDAVVGEFAAFLLEQVGIALHAFLHLGEFLDAIAALENTTLHSRKVYGIKY